MNGKINIKILLGIVGFAVWAVLYWHLESISHLAVLALSGLIPSLQAGNRTFESLVFFFYDTPKVLMLLVTVVFGVGIIRTFFSPERTRKLLAGRGAITGNALAALLGTVTPFCSCSAVPLFIGFLSAGVPLGATFSFLVSAPMVNEVALVLLFGMFGWKVAALYMGTGLAVAMLAGFVLGRVKLDHLVEDWVWEIRGGAQVEDAKMT